jgi:hypothetical protein
LKTGFTAFALPEEHVVVAAQVGFTDGMSGTLAGRIIGAKSVISPFSHVEHGHNAVCILRAMQDDTSDSLGGFAEAAFLAQFG